MDRLEMHRRFFARLIASRAGIAEDGEIAAAFASTPRERFVGPPPWKIVSPAGYIETPLDDPTLLYHDVPVSMGAKGHPLNTGQPSLHAMCLAALELKKGDRVVHVGAGTGYYTTLLAKLVGETGAVDAYEIEVDLAQRAMENLADFSWVAVHHRSGAEAPLPDCDAIYVNAGATAPLAMWLDALKVGGRLCFPLTPEEGTGAMLLIAKHSEKAYAARFLVAVQFVPCIGGRSESEAETLARKFRHAEWESVRSLHRGDEPDECCVFSGKGWWLSSLSPD